jgi:hypothetical protein
MRAWVCGRIAISVAFVTLIVVGDAVMWQVAGPARKDQLVAQTWKATLTLSAITYNTDYG